jgi:dihydropteroate synthase
LIWIVWWLPIASLVEPMPTWQLRHASLNWEKRPLLMGIVNLTPDSFADGGRYVNPDRAVTHAMQLVTEGADIIDLGAESSRPGAEPVSIGVEIERLLPVVTGIREVSDIPISIDTRKAEVAARALDAGADIINDITAGRDKEMLPLVAAADVPIILMHMQGEPQTMQKNPLYSDVVAEVGDALLGARAKAVAAGVKKVIVDPGIGFGKNLEHNLALLRGLPELRRRCQSPILLGASRKSMLGLLTGRPVDERLPASLAIIAWAVHQGVDIVRVHDVWQSRDVITTMSTLLR